MDLSKQGGGEMDLSKQSGGEMDLSKQSFDYTARIIELIKFLQEDNKDYPLCDQLIKNGLLIGLNCRKIAISNQYQLIQNVINVIEETDYIIEMAILSGYMTDTQSKHICADGKKLIKKLQELKH